MLHFLFNNNTTVNLGVNQCQPMGDPSPSPSQQLNQSTPEPGSPPKACIIPLCVIACIGMLCTFLAMSKLLVVSCRKRRRAKEQAARAAQQPTLSQHSEPEAAGVDPEAGSRIIHGPPDPVPTPHADGEPGGDVDPSPTPSPMARFLASTTSTLLAPICPEMIPCLKDSWEAYSSEPHSVCISSATDPSPEV